MSSTNLLNKNQKTILAMARVSALFTIISIASIIAYTVFYFKHITIVGDKVIWDSQSSKDKWQPWNWVNIILALGSWVLGIVTVIKSSSANLPKLRLMLILLVIPVTNLFAMFWIWFYRGEDQEIDETKHTVDGEDKWM